MLLAALVCGVGASILGANHASAFLGGLFAPEIELISVELVDQKDQVEMDFFGPNTPRPPRPLLKVRLRTNPDIHEYIEQNDYSLGQFSSQGCFAALAMTTCVVPLKSRRKDSGWLVPAS
jgi:hypothetical protein